MKKTVLSTPNAPSAIGPYSQGIRAGNMIYLSGQIPIDPATGDVIKETDIASQTRRCLRNVEGLLGSAGASLQNVVKATVFLKDMQDFAGMNGVYAEFFKEAHPARSTVEVARLPKDVKVEIECIAMVD